MVFSKHRLTRFAVLISLSKNFLFVHIPKTAGSSVRTPLLPYACERNRTLMRRALSLLPVRENPEKAYFRGHSTSEVIRRKLNPLLFEKLHKFSVVRNPYDHFVSSYFFEKNNVNGKRQKQARDWSLEDFLNYQIRKNKVMPRYQSAWLEDRAGNIQVDRILFVETLNQDYEALCEFLKLPQVKSVPKINVGKRADYRKYFDSTMKGKVERLYEPDFDNFGYSFETGQPTRNPLLK
ncbi:hypothetical protein CSC82_00225 [Rhodobacteraceae bacterium 4F10]|nr:hypothetical protein CSC82_00225 [Rhodobacteraceae bacterium 4F10]